MLIIYEFLNLFVTIRDVDDPHDRVFDLIEILSFGVQSKYQVYRSFNTTSVWLAYIFLLSVLLRIILNGFWCNKYLS